MVLGAPVFSFLVAARHGCTQRQTTSLLPIQCSTLWSTTSTKRWTNWPAVVSVSNDTRASRKMTEASYAVKTRAWVLTLPGSRTQPEISWQCWRLISATYHHRAFFVRPAEREVGAQPGAGLPQRVIAWAGHRQRAQPSGQLVPHLPVAQLSEQAPRQQQVDHHPRRQYTDPGLGRGGQRLVDHLKRHYLGQLTQMPRGEHPGRHRDRSGDDTLVLQRDTTTEHVTIAELEPARGAAWAGQANGVRSCHQWSFLCPAGAGGLGGWAGSLPYGLAAGQLAVH